MHYQAPSNTTKHPRPHPFIMTLLTAPMKSNQEIQLKQKLSTNTEYLCLRLNKASYATDKIKSQFHKSPFAGHL